MMDWSDWVLRYGVLLGKRNTQKQRLQFLRAIQKEFAEMGYSVDVTQSKRDLVAGSKAQYYNLYAGNVKNADVVIASYYDTPMKSFGAPYYAFRPQASTRQTFISLLFPVLLLIIGISMLYYLLLPNISQTGWWSPWGVLTIFLMCLLLWGITQIRSGIPNKHNMVKNTSSLLAMLRLAKIYQHKSGKKIAFAMLDGMTHSPYALQMLEAYLERSSKQTVVFLDCVGNPGDIQVFTKFTSTSSKQDVQVHTPDFEQQPWGDICVTAGVFEAGKVRIPNVNTNKDKNLDLEQMQRTVDALQYVIAQMK